MQCAVHNRATIRVANRTDLSDRAAADEVNHRFHNRIRKVCALVGATLILPALAYAQGSSPIAKLQAEVTALQTTVTALQNQVNSDTSQITALQTTDTTLQNRVNADATQITALQTNVTALQNQCSSDTSQITALQNQLAAVQKNNALLLGPFVSVDPNPENGVAGPNITFTGANIHIVSGSGATDDHRFSGGSSSGLGSLIIGYDEVPPPGTPPLSPGDRDGSHNLVIGEFNRFTSPAFGGLVAGRLNAISAQEASVSGGNGNTASNIFASVSGGDGNTASGETASVSGGAGNTASGIQASVSGGDGNTASGALASVIGGTLNTANIDRSIRPQPPFP
jgi:polyhydroxyalkanoate synthesis regulator phasin